MTDSKPQSGLDQRLEEAAGSLMQALGALRVIQVAETTTLRVSFIDVAKAFTKIAIINLEAAEQEVTK